MFKAWSNPVKPRSSKRLLTRAATFTPATFNSEQRSVGVVWSTGSPVERFDLEGRFIERLSMTKEAVDLSELRGAPVLNSHDRFDVRQILGVVESPNVDGERGTATVRFSDRPDVAGIVRDVEVGIISRISAGYRVSKWESSKDSEGNRVKTAVRWTPVELSFTAVPADPAARTRSVVIEVEDSAEAEDEAEDEKECDCPPGTSEDECECDEEESEETMTTKAAVSDQIRSVAHGLGVRGDF